MLGAVVVGALAGHLASARAGESVPNEVLLGTFHVGPAAVARESPAGEQQNSTSPRSEANAVVLYEEAKRDLAEGRRIEAQRLFEQIVARYPDEPMAAQSRLQLGLIYLDDLKAAAARHDAATRAPAPPPGSESIAALLGDNADAWRTEINPVRPSLDAFAAEAGDRVFFSSGSAELGGRGRSVLEAQARWLLARPDVVAVIEGHADDPASEEDNLQLSRDRAEAVRARLIAQGVNPERVTVAPFGRRNRVSECAETDCAARNRRAVTVVQYADGRQNTGTIAPYPAAAVSSALPSAVTGADVPGAETMRAPR